MLYDKSIIAQLESEYKLPIYIFDDEGFCKNYYNLYDEMTACYPNFRLSYSYKTNYSPYACKKIMQLGGYAEVVSGMEYHIAERIGYKAEHIIFNGPDKGEEGISAFLKGSIVNADNLEEINTCCETALKYPERSFKIGIRVNIDVGQNFVSRFGMDENDIEKAFLTVNAVPNLKISGLHCHISRCRGLDAWRRRTQIMLGLADRYFKESPEYIDLGSGMFGSMAPSFASQFDNIPTYKEYAKVTAQLFAEHYRTKNKPILFTEPGTTLVNRYFELIARVDAIKEIRGTNFAVLNCSEHNLGETCTLKQLPISIVECDTEHRYYENIDFTGYTCLEQDVLYRNYSGMLAVGDYVVFENVGGYSNVLKPPFIRPNCAMIAIKEDGERCLIKSAETFDDILHTYVF